MKSSRHRLPSPRLYLIETGYFIRLYGYLVSYRSAPIFRSVSSGDWKTMNLDAREATNRTYKSLRTSAFHFYKVEKYSGRKSHSLAIWIAMTSIQMIVPLLVLIAVNASAEEANSETRQGRQYYPSRPFFPFSRQFASDLRLRPWYFYPAALQQQHLLGIIYIFHNIFHLSFTSFRKASLMSFILDGYSILQTIILITNREPRFNLRLAIVSS